MSMIFVKVKEGIFRKPDGTLVLSVIHRVGGDAQAIDFSDAQREHPSSWPKVRIDKLGPELILTAYQHADEVTAARRSEEAQVSALEEHKRQINGRS